MSSHRLPDLKCVNAIGLSPVGQKSGKERKESACVRVTRFPIDLCDVRVCVRVCMRARCTAAGVYVGLRERLAAPETDEYTETLQEFRHFLLSGHVLTARISQISFCPGFSAFC